MDPLFNLIFCPIDIASSMVCLPTPETIQQILFKLNAKKSPGPDGLISRFYKAAWPILGAEVIRGIQMFFATGRLPYARNSIIHTLVLNHSGSSSISDYRPISCCNTLYKVISKILVKRLKPILPTLILSNQTAFVRGRLLVENTILASEIVHGYHRDKGPKMITIKVDIGKAFDTIN